MRLSADPGAAEVFGRLPHFLAARRDADTEVDFASVERRTLQPGVNDLGDIRLVRPPLVVAGRFRFEPAGAQRHVRVAVERWVEATEAGGAASWQAVVDDLYFFQSDGRFVVRGTPLPGRLRLSFGADAAPVEFARGAGNLVVETASRRR